MPEERRHALADFIQQQGYVALPDLVRHMGVSESTVRRDLDFLHETGVVRRTHGGATALSESGSLTSFDDRSSIRLPEKRAIARTISELVGDGETILLDGGTTTYEVARLLLGRPLQVVTNSLPIAQLLASNQQTDLIMLGGYVYPKTGVALGSITRQAMTSLRVDRLIMGVGGVNARGLYNGNLLLVETELAMMDCAGETNVVADHTKFDHQAIAYLTDWSRIDRVVVDSQVSQRQLSQIASHVEVLQAPVDGTDGRP